MDGRRVSKGEVGRRLVGKSRKYLVGPSRVRRNGTRYSLQNTKGGRLLSLGKRMKRWDVICLHKGGKEKGT